jgi:hypothetical protein
MTVYIPTAEEMAALTNRLAALENQLNEIKNQLPQRVRVADAIRLAGLSRRGLEIERRRPGSLIKFSHEGRTVWYDRQSLLDYAARRRQPQRERYEYAALI